MNKKSFVCGMLDRSYVQMSYRPLIDEEIDERAQLYMIGKTGDRNELYENAIKAMIDENGNSRDVYNMLYQLDETEYNWPKRLQSYVENKETSMGEVLELLITTVIDENGEAVITYKESVGLGELQ
jgi:hypothetical protein